VTGDGEMVSVGAPTPVPCSATLLKTVPSPTVTVAVAFPTMEGAKWMVNTQLWAGARPAEQALPDSTKPLPGADTVSAPVAAPPPLVTVKLTSELTVLTGMGPKSYEGGETVNAPAVRPTPAS